VLTLTKAKAARLVRAALARRYGRLFRHRSGYVSACTLSRSRHSARCRVRWRSAGRLYAGHVDIAYRVTNGRVVRAQRLVVKQVRR
jgi:hypothetical protein